MRKTLTLLVMAGLAVTLAAGEAAAQNYFGAISYSQTTRSHGYSYDYGSRSAAEQRAYNECAQYGGGCKIAVWFRNACGALAVGQDGGWGAGWNANRPGAEAAAINSCNSVSYGCSVIRWVCTTGHQ